MSTFRLKPEIEVFEKVDGYLSTYSFTEEDFILISKAVHDVFFKDKLGKAKVFFRSNYGSGEPSSSMVNALIQDFMDSGCTRITAIGGGSVIDMAKVLLVARDADVDALFTNPVNLERRYQLTAIPTTCGAGSEVSNISIVELESLKTKLGLAKDEIFPDQCILIPELMQGISTFSFITSAIDGMIHGIESYLSKRSNVYSRMFQEKCITMYLEGFKALQNGADKESLFTPFLIASNMAGIAFSNTGTGAVHAISYPLSGTYHVTHGLANSIFLTEVLKTYQRLDNRSELNELFKLMAKPLQCEASQVIEELENLLKAVIEIPGLQSLGMKEEEIVSFAKSVIELQQRLLTNGYVPLSQSDIENIYRNLW